MKQKPETKTKTIREWLEELPDGIRERAIRNAEDGEWDALGKYADSLSEALTNAFFWDDTEETCAFWSEVDDKAMGLRDNWPSLDGFPPIDSPDPMLERLDRIEAELRRLTAMAEREKSEQESPTPPPQSLPEIWMKPLPEGAVLLGRGGTFKVPASGRFKGWSSLARFPRWGWSSYLSGELGDRYYAAPADSEIARLNGLTPKPGENWIGLEPPTDTEMSAEIEDDEELLEDLTETQVEAMIRLIKRGKLNFTVQSTNPGTYSHDIVIQVDHDELMAALRK